MTKPTTIKKKKKKSNKYFRYGLLKKPTLLLFLLHPSRKSVIVYFSTHYSFNLQSISCIYWLLSILMSFFHINLLTGIREREKEMATHSRILAWEIPWTEEPGGLQKGWT